MVKGYRKSAIRFSCAALLAFVTISGILVGVLSDRAHRQQRLIRLLGGNECLIYDYQEEHAKASGRKGDPPKSPAARLSPWFVNALGEDWFVTVIGIELPYREGGYPDEFVDAMCDVRTLKYIRIGHNRLTKPQADRVLAVHGQEAILDSSLKMDR
jgi:hypothetical protein